MYIYIMHYLNFFLSFSIKNLTLASLSCLFTIKNDVVSIKAIAENRLHNFLINNRHSHEKYCFHNCPA